MAEVCPTVTAYTVAEYKQQMERIAPFAHRIQVDLTDGEFAPTKTVKASQAWWPVGVRVDLHLMYKNPLKILLPLLAHHPKLVIVHAEAEGDFEDVYRECRAHRTQIGLALLPDTPVDTIKSVLDKIDHVLLFAGKLGYFGGHSDMSVLSKAAELKSLRPELEIGWDGGVNSQNAAELILGGVDVLNVGGYIHKAEDPQKAYDILLRIADETGTT